MDQSGWRSVGNGLVRALGWRRSKFMTEITIAGDAYCWLPLAELSELQRGV